MKYGVLLILSLLICGAGHSAANLNTASSYATSSYATSSNASSSSASLTPIYIKDAISFFSSATRLAKIDSLLKITKNYYPIQVGAFRSREYAESYFNRIESHLAGNVEIIEEGGFFKVRVSKLDNELFQEFIDSGKNTETFAEKVEARHIAENSHGITDTLQLPAADSIAVEDTASILASLTDSSQLVLETRKIMNKLFILNSNSPWLKRINYFGKSFALVNALIITIIFSIASMIAILIVILLNRARMEKEERLRQYLSENFQALIIDYLFNDISLDKFRAIASDTYRRQVLIDQMIDVSINLKGEEEKKLIGLYKHLGLDRDSIKRAHDYRWHKKIKGFRELAFMNIKDANHLIYKALNSGNEILRMEAQIALVRLSDDDPFGFLSHLTRPFSLWEQITLHELIIQHDLPVPEFRKWLTSSNPTVVMFALRMIREFKQKDAENDIREVLLHSSEEVRHLAVQVAGDMDMRSTLEIMKRMYKDQEYNTCLEIVRSMGKMPDPSLMGFLKLVLDKEEDVQLQIEATKAIENHGEEGVKALVKLMKSEYKNYNIIVRHVLDRRIF